MIPDAGAILFATARKPIHSFPALLGSNPAGLPRHSWRGHIEACSARISVIGSPTPTSPHGSTTNRSTSRNSQETDSPSARKSNHASRPAFPLGAAGPLSATSASAISIDPACGSSGLVRPEPAASRPSLEITCDPGAYLLSILCGVAANLQLGRQVNTPLKPALPGVLTARGADRRAVPARCRPRAWHMRRARRRGTDGCSW